MTEVLLAVVAIWGLASLLSYAVLGRRLKRLERILNEECLTEFGADWLETLEDAVREVEENKRRDREES